MMKFADRLAFTEEEQKVVVINAKASTLLRVDRVFLVGRLLSRKVFNKERVTIVEMDEGLFLFGFESASDRSLVHKGGPWLYDGVLLVLVEADSLAHPTSIPLRVQEFWVQVKGLPFGYMTHHMGQFIGN